MTAPTCGVCGKQTPDGAYGCLGCVEELDQALGDVPALAEDLLERVVGKQTRYSDRVGSRSTGGALPVNRNAGTLVGSLRNTLGTWVRLIAEESHAELPTIDPAAGDDVEDIARLARWLLSRTRWLRLHPAYPEVHDEITAIVEAVREATLPPPPRWYAGRCEDCDRDLYGKTGGHELIECRCGRKYDVATRRTKLLEDLDDALGTVTEIARSLTMLSSPVTADMIYGYVRRKRLVAHATDSVGRALFRVGDVRRLVNEDRGRADRSRAS